MWGKGDMKLNDQLSEVGGLRLGGCWLSFRKLREIEMFVGMAAYSFGDFELVENWKFLHQKSFGVKVEIEIILTGISNIRFDYQLKSSFNFLANVLNKRQHLLSCFFLFRIFFFLSISNFVGNRKARLIVSLKYLGEQTFGNCEASNTFF